MLEPERYIHPNPLCTKLVKDLSDLDEYSYAGHRVLIEKKNHLWQDTAHVLSRFGRTAKGAMRKYRKFVAKGIPVGKRLL